MPVTSTVCGMFQLSLVNVRLAGLTVPSDGLLELSAMVTSADGCVFNTTVKCARPPASVVVRPEIGVTKKPATSLSMLVTDTSLAFIAAVVRIAARGRRRDDACRQCRRRPRRR